MQVNKQIIIILILASLLFSAIGAAYYFYNKNQQAIKSKNELVTVYIAKGDLDRNTLIEVKHLGQTKIAKQYILNKPLLKKEIIGKYTKEKIYKNEVFLKQKLNTKIQKNRAKLLDFEKGSYNMKFNLFDNPNYTLVQGDLINIISVFPIGELNKLNKYTNYDVSYVSHNIKVLGFIRDGKVESETITKHKVKKVVKKKVIEEIIDVKADEVIIDIDPMVLISLIKDYNKGNQLWMVKTKESILIEPLDKMSKEKQIEEIEKEKLASKDDIKLLVDKKKVKKVIKPRVFKYRWYKSKVTTITKSAVIDYSQPSKKKDDKNRKTKSVNIVINPNKKCTQIKDKLVVGNVNFYYIRSEATTKSKTRKLLSRNVVIPYLEKVNGWYKTCDNLFVSEKVVKPISYTQAVKKIGRK